MSTTNQSLYFSETFVISCGTVTIDSERSKVLLIHCRGTGEFVLPKGRKDINETLEQTAVRETFEETGIPVQLLPLPIPTLATVPTTLPATAPPATVTEPIAVAQRMTAGKLKIIFWFVAAADSTLECQEGTKQDNEDFDPVWVPFDEVLSTLSFDDDRQIAAKAVTAAQSLKLSQ